MATTISSELQTALIRNRRYLAAQLPDVVGLTLDEIMTLIQFGAFPPSRNQRAFGPSWHRTRVDRWARTLRNSPELARKVQSILGYRNERWG